MSNTPQQIEAFKITVLEEALKKAITKRERLATSLQDTNEHIKALQAATAQ